jgi:hypothetical protein
MAKGKKGKRSKKKMSQETKEDLAKEALKKFNASKAIEGATFVGLTYAIHEGGLSMLNLLGGYFGTLTQEGKQALEDFQNDPIVTAAKEHPLTAPIVDPASDPILGLLIGKQVEVAEGNIETKKALLRELDIDPEVLMIRETELENAEIARIRLEASIGSWLVAMGLAGAIMLLLQSYEVAELVEHLPLQ